MAMAKRNVVAMAIAFAVVLILAVVIGLTVAKFMAAKHPPFPIDVVCMWVDGSDRKWNTDLRTHFYADFKLHNKCGLVHSKLREPEEVPPGTKDELYYNCMSIAKFMPWVRTYFLVTARPHKPWWWPPSGKIGSMRMQLIHHDEIFDDPSILPVFNSSHIHHYLTNIPGLAERFVLYDDDFFVGQPMKPNHFFTDDGMKAVVRLYPVDISALQEGNWKTLCQNTISVAKDTFLHGAHPMFPEHVGYPMFKTALRHITHVIRKPHLASLHRFRSDNDIVSQYLAIMLMWRMGMTVAPPHTFVFGFIKVHSKLRAKDVFPRPPHQFCLNDRITKDDIEYLEKMVK